MNRIVTYVALFGLLFALACAAPAKKSEDTEPAQEIQETQETKQTSQETTEELTEDTKEEDTETTKSEDKPANQEVTRYQDIEVDDSKVTTENETPDKRSQVPQVYPQRVAEHILTQNEAITLVTELTDQDYVEQYLNNEGAQGLFEALDLLKDQGWITDIEYTIISDSLYQQMLAPVQVPYDIQYESSYPAQESEQIAQPIYTTNTLSSFTESEEQVDSRLASIVGGLLDRIAENDMTAEEGAEIIGTLVKFLYGIEQAEEATDYSESEWVVPQQLYLPLPQNEQDFQLPNGQGYQQDFDIVNSQGEPIGQAEEMINNYKTDDGELGQELAALEKVAGKFGDNGVFQGQQQVYQKEAVIPLSPLMGEDSSEEELGSGSSEEDNTNFMNDPKYSGFPWDKFLGVKV